MIKILILLITYIFVCPGAEQGQRTTLRIRQGTMLLLLYENMNQFNTNIFCRLLRNKNRDENNDLALWDLQKN